MTVDIAKLRALLDAATPRPWFAPEAGNLEWLYEDSVLTSGETPRISAANPGRVLARMNTNFPYRADLELICAAVNALPELLEANRDNAGIVEGLISERSKLLDEVDRLREALGMGGSEFDRGYNAATLASADAIALVQQEAARIRLVYEAVCAWRDAQCDDLAFCEYGDHEIECSVRQRENDLVAAIDAARKAGG